MLVCPICACVFAQPNLHSHVHSLTLSRIHTQTHTRMRTHGVLTLSHTHKRTVMHSCMHVRTPHMLILIIVCMFFPPSLCPCLLSPSYSLLALTHAPSHSPPFFLPPSSLSWPNPRDFKTEHARARVSNGPILESNIANTSFWLIKLWQTLLSTRRLY